MNIYKLFAGFEPCSSAVNQGKILGSQLQIIVPIMIIIVAGLALRWIVKSKYTMKAKTIRVVAVVVLGLLLLLVSNIAIDMKFNAFTFCA